MFASAVKRVIPFTHPLIISKRLEAGEVKCACATFIILNSAGWCLTAAHVLEDSIAKQHHDAERAKNDAAAAAIQTDTRLNPKQRRRELARLRPNPEWITDISYWWSADGVTADNVLVDPQADLAVGKLNPFDGSWCATYPVFRDLGDQLDPGTSLCRLGFPFHNIAATYDTATRQFRLPDGTLPVPRFPMDGIYTRSAIAVDPSSGRHVEFLETSTPGLKGQSGGPIFDVQGRICGVQSHTNHFELGFSPVVKRDRTEVHEHQFLNVGLGAHVKEVLAFLKKHNVTVALG